MTLEELRKAVAVRLVEIAAGLPAEYRLTLLARHATDVDAHIVITRDDDQPAVLDAMAKLLRLGDTYPVFSRRKLQQDLDVALARARALEARLEVGRQMATVLYNVGQNDALWDRAKRVLLELRQAWDRVAAEAAAPLDAGGPESAALSPFDRRCADALADEVATLVRRGVLDSRSPAADALLDYRDPPSSPRADRLAEVERQLTESTTRQPTDEFELRKQGGKWLAAARSWLQHRRTTKGVHGDQINWGDASAIFAISALDVEELAARIAAAAINEQGDLRPTLEHLRKARFEAQADAAIATARAGRAHALLRRMLNEPTQVPEPVMVGGVVDERMTDEWVCNHCGGRGDGVDKIEHDAECSYVAIRNTLPKPCDGDHAAPACADPQCWRREP